MKNLAFLFLLLSTSIPLPAQWQPVFDQPGGPVHQVGRLPDGTLFAGAGNGLYRSGNTGNSWSQVAALPAGQRVWSLAAKGQDVYAGLPTAVYHSPDGGNSWDAYPTPTNYYFSRLVPANALYGVSNGRLYRSDDQAQNWTLISGTDYVQLVSADNDLVVYPFNNARQLRRSTDQGNSWTTLNLPNPDDAILGVLVRGATIYVVTQPNSNGNKYLTTSFDQGDTWTAHYTIPLGTSGGSGTSTLMDWDEAANALVTTFYSKVFATADHGANWSYLAPASSGITILEVLPFGGQLFAAGYTGFYYKKDATTAWDIKNNGLRAQSCTMLKAFGDELFAFFSNNLYRSADGGLSWTKVYVPGGAGAIADMEKFGNRMFLLTKAATDNFFYSTDNGASWKQAGGQGGSGVDLCLENTELYIERENVIQKVSVFQPETVLSAIPTPPSTNFRDFLPGDAPEEHIALAQSGQIHRWNPVSSQWSLIAQIPIPPNSNGSGHRLFKAGNTYLASVDSKLFFSNDKGLSWQQCQVPGNMKLLAVELVDTPQGWFLLTQMQGILQSPAGDQPWALFNHQFPSKQHYGMAYAQGSLYMGLENAGVWQYDLNVAPSAAGIVYDDKNQNGMREPGEAGVPGILLESSGQKYSSTDAAGMFRFYDLAPGETIGPVTPNAYTFYNPPQRSFTAGTSSGYDFGRYSLPGPDLQVVLTDVTPFRPGFLSNLELICRNLGSNLAPAVELNLELPAELFYWNATPAPSFISGNTLRWLAGDLLPGQEAKIDITVLTEVSTPINTPLKMDATANLAATDLNPADNVYQLERTVRGAIDPNDKSVSPEYILPADLQSGKHLEYTIRFQNTGNYPAEFVRIRDVLAQNLDLSSFHLLAASHACRWEIKPGRILEFLFPDIQLPDSLSNEPESHGYVKFAIRPEAGLSVGEVLENTADIYFDYNAPVRTNTSISNIVYFLPGAPPLYTTMDARPTPASYSIGFYWIEPAEQTGTLRLFNLNGILVAATPVPAGSRQVDLYVADQENGVYVAVLEAGTRKYVRQVVVQRGGQTIRRRY